MNADLAARQQDIANLKQSLVDAQSAAKLAAAKLARGAVLSTEEQEALQRFTEIQNKIKNDASEKSWSTELDFIFNSDKTNLKSKVNNCLSLDKYQEISKRLNLNNQRLMIINKPVYYSK